MMVYKCSIVTSLELLDLYKMLMYLIFIIWNVLFTFGRHLNKKT